MLINKLSIYQHASTMPLQATIPVTNATTAAFQWHLEIMGARTLDTAESEGESQISCSSKWIIQRNFESRTRSDCDELYPIQHKDAGIV
jgi:hypothetical protein